MRLWPTLCAAVLLVVSRVAPLAAQDSPRADGVDAAETAASDAARTAFELGRAATERGRHDEARAHFARSFELEARLSTAYNLAVASRLAGHPTEAASLIERILSGELGPLERERRVDVEAQLASLRRTIARVTLRVGDAPADAWIVIDDAARAPLASPHAEWLAPGRHRIRIGADATRETLLELDLRAGEDRDVTLALTPSRGTLVIEAEHATDVVLIDGEERGRGRVSLALDEGTYRATIAGCETCARDVDVRGGAETRVVLARGGGSDDAPWIVALVVAGAALVGGAVATAVVVGSEPSDPFSDPVFGVVVALGSR